jgi:hypothetical protein
LQVVITKKFMSKFRKAHQNEQEPTGPAVDVTPLSNLRELYSVFDHGEPLIPENIHLVDREDAGTPTSTPRTPDTPTIASFGATMDVSDALSVSASTDFGDSVVVTSPSTDSAGAKTPTEEVPVSLDNIALDVN